MKGKAIIQKLPNFWLKVQHSREIVEQPASVQEGPEVQQLLGDDQR